MIKTFEYLKNWANNKQSITFFLPDGSQGRPFDNQYHVETVQEKDGKLILRLTNNLEFIFEGKVQYRDDVCNLILFDFDKLVCKTDNTLTREYPDGEFCLVGF